MSEPLMSLSDNFTSSSSTSSLSLSHSIKPLMINKVKDRGLILSPTVQAGLERECNKNDFFREGDKFIGKGGFGEVWKVIHKTTNKVYVVKVIDKKSIQEQKLVDQMNREIDIMYKVNHPHVMKLVNHFEDDDKFYMIMPYASKGQLYSLVRRQVRFDQRTAAQYMRETIEAVRYLHSFTPKIIHRDIKPENLLLDDNYRILLSDFGWSNFKDEGENRKTYCGTPEYLAPEMVRKTGHDHSVDIWSLGVLLFELLAGYAPFTGGNQAELFLNIKKLKINWPLDFPPLAKNLVSKILKLNPKERISLEQISEHSWFDKNPPLRPVLTNYLTDEKKILASHLINVSPDAVQEEINDIVNPDKRRKYSTLRTRKNSSSHNELKTLVTQFQSEADKMRKENAELRSKLALGENELKTLRSGHNELENSQIHDQIRLLNEELERHKIMNNERLGLLTEIEEKSNEIIELKSKNSNCETEKLNANRIIIDLNEKINDYAKSQSETELKLESLNKQLQSANATHDGIEAKYHSQIDMLQSGILDNESESEDSKIANVILVLTDDIGDVRTHFTRRVNVINDTIEAFTEEYKKRESDVEDMLMNYLYKNITTVMDKFKSAIKENIDKAKEKANKEQQRKTEMIDWQKAKINELQQYKTKTISNEAKVRILESQLKGIKDKLKEEEDEIVRIEGDAVKVRKSVCGYKKEKNEWKKKVDEVNEYIKEHCKDAKVYALYKRAFGFEEEEEM